MWLPSRPAERRRRGRALRAGAAAGAILVTALLAPSAPVRAIPATSSPVLELAKVVRTSPFAGSHRSMLDNEGSGYVPRDRVLWIVDDDGKKLFAVDTRTGRLRRTLDHDDLAGVRKKGGRHHAGQNRVGDLEAVAYDRKKDQLFVFSGSSSPNAKPAVFRLDRKRGKLRLDSYQSLPAGSDFTAAAWNPADKELYVGLDRTIWSYRYKHNKVGSPVAVPDLTGVMGMTFTRDGAGLLVARYPATVSLIDWASRSIVPGWSFDLSPWGVLDARAVELVKGRLWVSDGYDLRAPGDPLDHALFVFDID
jgi:hypothetical protein